MKPIKEWLEELPEPYRSQALANSPAHKKSIVVASLDEAIMSAFGWGETPEGGTFWDNLHDRAMSGEFNTPSVPTPAPVPDDGRKPFNLEAAKAGKPAVFGNGTSVYRFLAFDMKVSGYPILASYLNERGQEVLVGLTEKGEYNLHGSCDGSQWDVFMAPEKVTVYVNAYRSRRSGALPECGGEFLSDRETAEERGKLQPNYIGAFPIEITL